MQCTCRPLIVQYGCGACFEQDGMLQPYWQPRTLWIVKHALKPIGHVLLSGGGHARR